MTFFSTQNPGIGGLDELTDSEALFLQNLGNLPYVVGDILYHNGSNLTRLAVGVPGTKLTVNNAGTAPMWSDKRVVTQADDATAVINIDITDVYELSAIANPTTFTITGTPRDGQSFIVRYKDAGVSKALTWTGFTAIGVTLPTSTTAGKWTYVGVQYNLATTAYHVIAVVTQA